MNTAKKQGVFFLVVSPSKFTKTFLVQYGKGKFSPFVDRSLLWERRILN